MFFYQINNGLLLLKKHFFQKKFNLFVVNPKQAYTLKNDGDKINKKK